MKDKIILFIKDNIKWVVIGLIFSLVVVVGIILIVKNIKEENKIKDEEKREKEKKDAKEDLEKRLREIGVIWYEEHYFIQAGEEINLDRFTDSGVSTNVANLSVLKVKGLDEMVKNFKNPITGEDCDKEKSFVKVFPKEPYGKEDYEIEVNLVCGLD